MSPGPRDEPEISLVGHSLLLQLAVVRLSESSSNGGFVRVYLTDTLDSIRLKLRQWAKNDDHSIDESYDYGGAHTQRLESFGPRAQGRPLPLRLPPALPASGICRVFLLFAPCLFTAPLHAGGR